MVHLTNEKQHISNFVILFIWMPIKVILRQLFITMLYVGHYFFFQFFLPIIPTDDIEHDATMTEE